MHRRYDDGKKCTVYLRHGKEPDGYFMAEYRGFINWKKNEIKLYRSRFSVNGCPKETKVSLFDVRAEPVKVVKKEEPAKVPEKIVRHRPAECPGQLSIEL